MWFFWGCCVVAAVLWYWLRRIARAGAVLEAAANRAAANRGEPPVSVEEPKQPALLWFALGSNPTARIFSTAFLLALTAAFTWVASIIAGIYGIAAGVGAWIFLVGCLALELHHEGRNARRQAWLKERPGSM